jgi:hypothetical protein
MIRAILGVMDRDSKRAPVAKSDAPSSRSRKGADGFFDDLASARRELLAGRHEAYHRVLGALIALISGPEADDALLGNFDRVWRSRSFPTFYERPLLVLAAMRADALQEGAVHPLYDVLAAATPDPATATASAVMQALGRERVGVWSTLTSRRVQTNDTSRGVAWLWPAFLAGCNGSRRPLALMDIGAGAGLNLLADQLPIMWTDAARGEELPCANRVATVARIGFDPRALNVQSEDDVLWMRACIWPGEADRLARFEESVRIMRAAAKQPSKPVLERLTASLVPARMEALAGPMPANTLVLAYQTFVSGYLETTEREHYKQGMHAFLARRVAGRGVWVELEIDDARRHLPAVFTAHVRAGDTVRSFRIGRASQHPTKVDVDPTSVTELRRYLAIE